MICIFCLEEKEPSDEHVFPLAIGGTLRTDRVCEPCNSYLGAFVDAPLSNHKLIAMRRAELGLAGNAGKVPEANEILLRQGTLVGDPTQKIRTVLNQETGLIEPRVMYNAKNVTLPNGTIEKQIIIDAETPLSEIKRIIQRERKRGGQNPLSETELVEMAEKFQSNVRTIETPTINYRVEFKTDDFHPGMLKIIYELAFLWTGEEYLKDPIAYRLRD